MVLLPKKKRRTYIERVSGVKKGEKKDKNDGIERKIIKQELYICA
jgi:hypothetical protein